MRKEVILLAIFIAIFAGVLGCSISSKMIAHQSVSYDSEFPYALLTSDFGILKREDLAINSCFVKPAPFSENSTTYFYWQCFEARQSNLFCEGEGYDKEEQARLAVMVIAGILNGEVQRISR